MIWYDNRRKIIESVNLDDFDLSNKLLESEPLNNINHCKTLRFWSKFQITIPYNKNNSNKSKNTYKNHLK